MGLMRAVGNGGVCPTLEAAIGHNRWQAVSHLPRGCCKFLQNTEESNNHVLRHEAVGDALGRPRAALDSAGGGGGCSLCPRVTFAHWSGACNWFVRLYHNPERAPGGPRGSGQHAWACNTLPAAQCCATPPRRAPIKA